MAKWQNDAMLDAALNYIVTNASGVLVCSGQPANYAGIAAVQLTGWRAPAFESVTDGAVSGRKLPVSGIADIMVASSGTATHVVLSSANTLLYVTTCTSQAVASGNTVTIPAWAIEIADVTP